ncbi:MAG: glycerophosphodiester phosphodiesterase family protein [Verrucomicrobiota bacterium]
MLGILAIGLFFIGHASSVGFGKDGLDNWKAVNGDWRLENRQLCIDAADEQATMLSGSTNRQNCIIEADVSFEEIVRDDCWLSIAFRAVSDGSAVSHCFMKPEASANAGCGFIVGKQNQWSVRKTASAKTDFETGKFRRLKVVVQSETVTAYLDGEKLFSSPYCVDVPTGLVGFGVYGCKAVFSGFSVTDLPDSEPIQRKRNDDYLIVAHRGYSAKYPENTVASIEGGIAAGSDGIEFDLHRCASGQTVLLHDYTLERTTDGEGAVAEATLADLQKLDAGSWKGAQFAGERVPTLDEALKAFDGTDVTAVIEVKAADVDAKDLVGLLSSHEAKACVISFHQEKIKEIKKADSNIRCGLLVGGVPAESDPADWMLEQAKKLGCEVLSINFQVLSPDIIKKLRENNIETWAWTVNDTAVMQALVDWGIDGITTDLPEARKGINN